MQFLVDLEPKCRVGVGNNTEVESPMNVCKFGSDYGLGFILDGIAHRFT